MPVYIYKNPKNGDIKEIVQGMNDEHKYEEDGVEWDRVFLSPTAFVKEPFNPWSAQSFAESSAKMKGTVGDLMDKSQELSEKRAQECGVDPVKQKAFDDYAKARKGRRHPEELKNKVVEI